MALIKTGPILFEEPGNRRHVFQQQQQQQQQAKLELELIHTQITQKPMLRVKVCM